PCRRLVPSALGPEYAHPSSFRASFEGRTDSKGDAAESLVPGLASPLTRASRLLRPDLGLRVLPRTLLLDDAHRLDHVERPLHLDVLLELLHRIECRRPLSHRRRRLFRDLHDNVRGDALAVDRPPLGGEVL